MAMDFSDGDDFGDSDNDALLFAATQLEASQNNANGDFEESPRPHKRRRTLPRVSEDFGMDDSIDDDALFAATLQSQYDAEYGAAGGKENRNEGNGTPPSVKKPRHHFFEPRVRMNMEKVVITQTQATPIEASQPWQIRGPVYVKRRPQDPAEDNEAMSPPPRPQPLQPVFRQTSRPVPAPAAPPKAPADDYLDNLPSDAFSSQDDGAKQPIYVSSQQRSPNRGQKLVAPLNGLRQTTLFGKGMANAPASQVNKRHAWPAAQRDEPPTHHELDSEGTKTWVYPTNLGKIRDYQYNIVHRGLFHNLLVALPTGLGKTFIAATVMLNWFRWTKNAQIIFVAPTKPLVAQQVDACFNIAGIPRSATTMLTGEINRKLRVSEWQDKRVFFMTPQTLINDLKSGFADPKRIVLLVVDEAHRATGAYAYVEVVKFLRRFNESFRVLALTATPGGDVEAVQKVIDGLEIARVEIRTEQSLDIREFSHTRDVEKEVFKISEEMDQLMQLYTKAVQPLLNIVVGMNAHWQKDPIMLTPFGCTQAMQKWAGSDAGRHGNQGVKGMVFSIFSTLASLAHSMDLLKYHGVGPMYSSLRNFRDDTKKSKYRTQILTSDPFEKLMRLLAMWTADPDFTGHPKLARCREVILNHLMDVGEGQANLGAPSNTRIMVFAHYRDSAEEIARVLKKDSPLIRPHVFVGQSGAKNSEGMSQKVQLDVIDKFKKGTYNVLIATSIGEEGLDIGEVDLIICYDSKASPLRMLQRMGRTGRKRAGRIVLFQMEGKEENDAAKAKDSYEHMQGIIAAGDRFTFHDDKNRRILPKLIEPVVDKRAVEIPIENTQRDSLPVPTAKGRGKLPKLPPKKFHMPDNARKGFTTAARMDDEDDEGSDIRRLLGKTKPKVKSEPKMETVVPPLHSQTYLNDAENNTLQSLYLKTCDEDEQIVISMPDFTKHPERQRKLGHIGSVKHGRFSSELVRTMERIHAIDEIEASRMLHLGGDESLDFMDESALIADRPASPMWEDDDGIEPETAKKRRVSATKKPAKPRSAAAKTTKATKGPAERRSLPDSPGEDGLPEPAKKPRGRPPKKKAASPNEVHAQTEVHSPPLAKAAGKKVPKPRKAPAPRRSRIPRSPGEADEAPASSAPRSDPFMARATQGFDIGSEDTDDERDAQEDQGDYRDDSDLASFIAEDDEAIAVRSSSVPRPSFDRTPGSARPKKTKLKRVKRVAGFILSDAEEVDEENIFSDDEPVRNKPKKRRVVESDDGSDD